MSNFICSIILDNIKDVIMSSSFALASDQSIPHIDAASEQGVNNMAALKGPEGVSLGAASVIVPTTTCFIDPAPPKRPVRTGSFKKEGCIKKEGSFKKELSREKSPNPSRTGSFNSPIIERSPGVLSHVSNFVDYEAQVKLFTCPACKDYLIPPIPQCRRGHVICSNCKVNLKGSCPQCKQTFIETPNLMMEKMAATIKFPCKHNVNGCTEKIILRNKAMHEGFCVYKPVHCPNEPLGCEEMMAVVKVDEHDSICKFKKK